MRKTIDTTNCVPGFHDLQKPLKLPAALHLRAGERFLDDDGGRKSRLNVADLPLDVLLFAADPTVTVYSHVFLSVSQNERSLN